MDRPELKDNVPSSVDSSNEILWLESPDVFRPPVRPKSDFAKEIRLVSGKCLLEEASVFIHADAVRNLRRESTTDTSREHGGILLGHAFQDQELGHYVVVLESVAAIISLGSSVHLRFVDASWEPVWKRTQEAPELQIVGWYHTHPGLGVFMSGTDLKTQRLHFGQPWQVAIVIDPVADRMGCFLGADGKRRSPTIFEANDLRKTEAASDVAAL
jgi:proteasome lid subunit RPN8/RPN11